MESGFVSSILGFAILTPVGFENYNNLDIMDLEKVASSLQSYCCLDKQGVVPSTKIVLKKLK